MMTNGKFSFNSEVACNDIIRIHFTTRLHFFGLWWLWCEPHKHQMLLVLIWCGKIETKKNRKIEVFCKCLGTAKSESTSLSYTQSLILFLLLKNRMDNDVSCMSNLLVPWWFEPWWASPRIQATFLGQGRFGKVITQYLRFNIMNDHSDYQCPFVNREEWQSISSALGRYPQNENDHWWKWIVEVCHSNDDHITQLQSVLNTKSTFGDVDLLAA